MVGRQKEFIGRVTSDKMDQTVLVEVESRKQHPIYKKSFRTVKAYKVHNEGNQAKYGDTVRIVETRPLSREKHFRVGQIITKGKLPEAAEKLET